MSEYAAINDGSGPANTDGRDVPPRRQAPPGKSGRLLLRDTLVTAGEYELAIKYLGDPIYAFENARNHRELTISRHRRGKPGADVGFANRSYQQTVEDLLTMTRQLGMNKAAKEIEKRHEQYQTLQ